MDDASFKTRLGDLWGKAMRSQPYSIWEDTSELTGGGMKTMPDNVGIGRRGLSSSMTACLTAQGKQQKEHKKYLGTKYPSTSGTRSA